MLDINLFRVEKGHDPERIRESQRKRFARVELVDEIIDLDKKWRERKFFFSSFLLTSWSINPILPHG
jgi:seryl-tRNA synthetase